MIRRGVILVALERDCSFHCLTRPPRAIGLLILAPFEVNAVSLAKVRALLDGPPGKKHTWIERVREAYATGMNSTSKRLRRTKQRATLDIWRSSGSDRRAAH